MTPRQKEMLEIIGRHFEIHGVAPTVREMINKMGLASTQSAVRLLDTLEAEGYVIRFPGRHRGLMLVNPLRNFSTQDLRAELARRSADAISTAAAAVHERYKANEAAYKRGAEKRAAAHKARAAA